MSKKLEDLFNLPEDDAKPDATPDEPDREYNAKPLVPGPQELKAMDTLEKIEDALPSVKGLTAADEEMDELADLAKASYQDLMDLGMNVEARWASEILGSASQFLGHAITAKTAKINKKLKMIDLQLKKAKLDADQNPEELGSASGSIMDRNELLEQILKQHDQDKGEKGSKK